MSVAKMAEPITTATVMGVAGSFLLRKGSEALWSRLLKYLRPDALCNAIAASLAGDETLAAIYDTPPRLDQERLTKDRLQQLLDVALRGDDAALGTYLLEEQLVDLSPLTKSPQESFDPVWRCIGHCIRAAVEGVVVIDPELARRHQLAMAQHHVAHDERTLAQHNEILSHLQDLKTPTAESTLPGSLTPSALTRSLNVLAEQNERLEQELREQLDKYAEDAWEKVLTALREHDLDVAVKNARTLSDWLTANEAQLSSAVRGRAKLLLAQAALIEEAETGGTYAEARRLYSAAMAAFGDAPSDENRQRIIAFGAKLQALSGDVPGALCQLAEATQAASIAARLAIAIDNHLAASLVDWIRSIPLDESWCDLAAYVHVAANDLPAAQRVFEWASKNGTAITQLRCRAAIVNATLSRLDERYASRPFSPLSSTPEDRQDVEDALGYLTAAVDSCFAAGTVRSGLEADCVIYAYTCHRVLGRVQEARRLLPVLASRRPMHLELARAVMRGDIPAPPHMSGRIREDHPSSLLAHDLAFSLDMAAGTSTEDLLSRCHVMTALARSRPDRERVAERLVQLAAAGPPEVFEQIETSVIGLVGRDDRRYHLLLAAKHLKAGELDACEAVLDSLTGGADATTEQFRAYLLLERGRRIEAAEAFAAIGERMAEPEMLRKAARLVLTSKPPRLDIAVDTLSKALLLDARDIASLEMLAETYVRLNGHSNAAGLLRTLRDICPERTEYAISEAQCLALSHRPTDALVILDDLCRRSDATVAAHVIRAMIRCEIGRPVDALKHLEESKGRFWGDGRFVTSYMRAAYASNSDRRAHEAFVQLIALQQAKKLEKDVLQPKTLDDFERFAAEEMQARRIVSQEIIAGKMPWTFADRLFGNVPFFGWRVRTQEVSWVSDDPVERSSFCIYSTNGLTILDAPNRHLARIECAAPGTEVVADYSALITLDRLGLLSEAIEYFGRMRVAGSSRSDAMAEAGRLQPYQLSQRASVISISDALLSGRLHIVSEVDTGEWKRVDEYAEDPSTYRVRDVLAVLESEGYLGRREREEVAPLSLKEAASATGAAPIESDDVVSFGLASLKLLEHIGLLNATCAVFARVGLSADDRVKLDRDRRHFEVIAETYERHRELWRALTSDPRVDTDALLLTRVTDLATSGRTADADVGTQHGVETSNSQAVPPGDEGDDEEEDHGESVVAIDAALVARQDRLPLLADDRVCQSIVLLANSESPSAAFGTDCVIAALLREGKIDRTRAATAFVQMMKWRYRFLVPPPDVVEAILEVSAARDRRIMYRYAHDCMRDAGLFTGLEQVEPPMPMAWSQYQEWLHSLGKSIAGLWLSGGDEDRARQITLEVLSEGVPIAPRAVAGLVYAIDAPQSVILGRAMLRLGRTADRKTANACLRTIAEGLGMEDDTYVQKVLAVAHAGA